MHLASSYVHPIRDGSGAWRLIGVFVPNKEDEQRPIVIRTELADNPGLSILHRSGRISARFPSLPEMVLSTGTSTPWYQTPSTMQGV